MELEYIKASGIYYIPQKSGVRDKNKIMGNYPVCLIKKLLFNKWEISYYDTNLPFIQGKSYQVGDEDIPNSKIIIYPSAIEEIKYIN